MRARRPSHLPYSAGRGFFPRQRVEPTTTFPLGKSALKSESPRRVHRVGYEWAFLATILASRPQRVGRRLVSVQAGGAALPRCTIMEELMFYRGMTCEGD